MNTITRLLVYLAILSLLFENDNTEREKYSRLLELNGLGVSNLQM